MKERMDVQDDIETRVEKRRGGKRVLVWGERRKGCGGRGKRKEER